MLGSVMIKALQQDDDIFKGVSIFLKIIQRSIVYLLSSIFSQPASAIISTTLYALFPLSEAILWKDQP